MVTNNVSEGSYVTQGGTASYKIKLKSLYIVQQNALLDIKISTIDICLTHIASKPQSLMISVLMNENFNNNAKVEQLTKMF